MWWGTGAVPTIYLLFIHNHNYSYFLTAHLQQRILNVVIFAFGQGPRLALVRQSWDKDRAFEFGFGRHCDVLVFEEGG